ncbi:MAG TPA: hypothetical protein DCL95_12225 [Rhodospirillaceae bacterium]|nr:hypothetical protein [Rhodospirillaceae bacterium]MBB58185.1 hypothetical protein [Rhodospirillaceae bacterium]HAD99937.1 hypothetical protein [Rhodospirillaceae bacterium]HAJ20805.1 hypothetical protein [Rhodospirillaceae bacterium]HBM12979.1 hypothetical protein [Rhodospirillaceae bacterium]|tara:strand:- start:166 stop:576 length:411 start_codon:yes stop_codon:yes gene_type:complete
MIVFDKLSLRQKTVLLALAKRMMIADSKVVIEEDALFGMLHAELGANLSTPTQDVFGEIDVSVFDDAHSQVVLILTLATMAFVDDNFHPNESSVLMKVTEQVNFSPSEIAAVMDLAERQGRLIKDTESLFQRMSTR